MLGRMATLNGKPVSADDLLPLALTNVGHFTSMRVNADGSIRGLALHLERLTRDCTIVWGAALDIGRVRECVRQALEGQTLPCVVRVTIYDPGIEMGRPAPPTSRTYSCPFAAPAHCLRPPCEPRARYTSATCRR
ncbi:hypothetical protein SMICM304S_10494 [Streptomyces microflavus]